MTWLLTVILKYAKRVNYIVLYSGVDLKDATAKMQTKTCNRICLRKPWMALFVSRLLATSCRTFFVGHRLAAYNSGEYARVFGAAVHCSAKYLVVFGAALQSRLFWHPGMLSLDILVCLGHMAELGGPWMGCTARSNAFWLAHPVLP